jgi:hypothetical protein
VTTDDVTIDLITTNTGNVDITIDGDLEITNFASDDELTLSGTGDVTLRDSDELSVVYAAGLTGELTIGATSSDTDLLVAAGSGALDLTLGDGVLVAITADTEVTGSIDDDAVDASIVTIGTVSFDGLAGDDTLTVQGITTGTIAFDGGDGTDTLSLGAATLIIGETVTLTDVEAIDLAGSATVSADLLDGEAFEVTGAGIATSTLTVVLDAGSDTADLSSIDTSDSATTGVVFRVIGGTGDDTITSTGSADIISGGAGADTLIDGGGVAIVSYTDAVLHGVAAAALSGMAINLSATAITAADIATAMGGTVVIGGGAGVAGAALAAGSAGYLAASAGVSTTTMVRDTVTGFQNVIGSTLADFIVGSAGDDVITGGAGADVLKGGAGDDTFVIGNLETGIALATADKIVDFLAADDSLQLGLAGDATAITGNYVEAAAGVADFTAAIGAANTALGILAAGPTNTATELYAFEFDASNGYLFVDTDANGVADEVIVLVGIDNTEISAANIIA